MSDPGAQLRANNERIIHVLLTLKSQRAELCQLIEKQDQEKKKLHHEVERIQYKLTLISKSLAQRLAARDKYDITIKEAEENYKRIVECSGILLSSVQKEYGVLTESMDKRVGTEAADFKEFKSIEVSPRGDYIDESDNYEFGQDSTVSVGVLPCHPPKIIMPRRHPSSRNDQIVLLPSLPSLQQVEEIADSDSITLEDASVQSSDMTEARFNLRTSLSNTFLKPLMALLATKKEDKKPEEEKAPTVEDPMKHRESESIRDLKATRHTAKEMEKQLEKALGKQKRIEKEAEKLAKETLKRERSAYKREQREKTKFEAEERAAIAQQEFEKQMEKMMKVHTGNEIDLIDVSPDVNFFNEGDVVNFEDADNVAADKSISKEDESMGHKKSKVHMVIENATGL